MNVSIKVEGLAELERKLLQLPVKVGEKVIKQAGRYAMKPVLEDARAKVPVRSGLLRDSLRITSRTARLGRYPIEIGISPKRKVTYEDAELGEATGFSKIQLRSAGWRWHFIETGAPARGIPARPFLRPAMDANKQKVLDRFKARLARAIDQAARK